MSYALPRISSFQRSSLLTVVIGLHLGIFFLMMTGRTVAPPTTELPLIVDLIEPPKPLQLAKASPQPPSKPQIIKQQQAPLPQPKAPSPAIEVTQSSTAPSYSAPAAAPEIQPAPPVTAAESVTQARFDADYLKNPAPTYPPLSRRMGEEGKVILRISVTPEGTADSIDIKNSSGSTRLDEAAVNTVKRWKFLPARRGNLAIQSWVLVPIIFKLEQ